MILKGYEWNFHNGDDYIIVKGVNLYINFTVMIGFLKLRCISHFYPKKGFIQWNIFEEKTPIILQFTLL